MRTILIAVTVLLALPSAAHAGRVERVVHGIYDSKYGDKVGEYGELVYTADPGEQNRIELRADGGSVVLSDAAGAEAGAGCEQLGPDRVRCPSVSDAGLTAGDGDDVVDSVLPFELMAIDGGDGDDRLTGNGALTGGPGDDVLRAGPLGASMYGGTGADDLIGGAGRDSVGFGSDSGPIHADFEGDADDGAAGEGDRIDPAVDNVYGTEHGDVLVGDDRANGLYAGDPVARDADSDVVTAGGGDDRVHASSDDRVDLGAGDDSVVVTPNAVAAPGRVDGGPGNDDLSGSIGPDRLVGGLGRDEIHGEGGDDAIDARDGAADYVTCVPDRRHTHGTASADGADLVQGCATIDRGGAARVWIVEAQQYEAVLECSSDQPGGCRGRLRVTRGGRTVVERRFRVIPGGRQFVEWYRRSELRPGRYVLFAVTRDTRGRRAFVRYAFTVAGRRP